MKISCDIIKDLLPLYVEDLASEDTRMLVEEHVADCLCCKKNLQTLRTNETIVLDTDPETLNHIKKTIQNKKRWSVAAAVLLLITILTGIILFLSVPVWLNAEQAIASVDKLDDGQIRIQTTDMTCGIYGVGLDTGDTGRHWGFIFSMQRIRMLFPPQISQQMNDASKEGYYVFGHTIKDGTVERYAYEQNYYYMDYTNGSVEAVLWDAGHTVPKGNIMADNSFQHPSLILQWLCIGAGVLFALCGAAWLFLRKRRSGKWFALVSEIFGAYSVSSLLVTSARFMTIETADLILKLVCILGMTVLILSTIACTANACKEK